MYRIIFLLFLAGNLFANDLVNMYRLQGIDAVEEKISQTLKNKEYWDKYLENKNVDYGYYETKKFVIITQKEIRELSLYKKDGNDFSLVSRNSVIVGEKEGDKFVEGDKKTPEGAYELLNKKTNLDQFYGPFALVTSYPNTLDRIQNKKGHGIWIHGMPLNEEREKYTRGCIALDNPQLESLEKEIDLSKAILLTSHGEFKKAKKNHISKILSAIYNWRDSWKKSDINKYLAFYSESFKKEDGTDLKKFSQYKKRVFRKNERKRIKFSNIDISPYPNSLNKTIYKVIMDEDYKSPTVRFKGKKELFFEVVNDEVKILAEG